MDSDQRQRLGQILSDLRGDRSQRQYAKDLGISYAALRTWEEGESVPGLENLETIAAARGQELIELLQELRGESVREISTPSKAEDVLRDAELLPASEQLRLAKLLIERQIPGERGIPLKRDSVGRRARPKTLAAN